MLSPSYCSSTVCRSSVALPVDGRNSLETFAEYVDKIDQLAKPSTTVSTVEWRSELTQCLDGGPKQILRMLGDQAERRQQGAYFTGAKLAARVANVATKNVHPSTCFYDPACGAGDLMLAIANRLPVAATFQQTLDEWGKRLAGQDISAEFVRLAKARLTLFAAKRCRLHPPLEPNPISDPFPLIVEGDSLCEENFTLKTDVVVMNPPFAYGNAPEGCEWASGRINLAALFLARYLCNSAAKTRIVAILPDVLRSGSRYVAWRDMTRDYGLIHTERSLGVFDQWTDVDVYLLHIIRGSDSPKTCQHGLSTFENTRGVGKRFHVHVGPVVPHRHPNQGPMVPYLHARSIPPWAECSEVQESRQFNGRLFHPPFVTIRRTSRPDAGKRAVATVVLDKRAVAVENHLVVCVPKDGRLDTCRELVRRLRSPKTDVWLNRNLRCRHLTTRLLSQMPWWYKL